MAVIMELKNISWDVFVETGDIEAYLLYKSINENNSESEIEAWELSRKKVLS